MSLIKQLYGAVGEWSRKTGAEPFGLMVTMSTHSGHIKFGNENESKMPLHEYLMLLSDEGGISEVVLITGLIKAVEIYLVRGVSSYDKERSEAQKRKDFAEHYLENPDGLNLLFKDINEQRQTVGEEPLASLNADFLEKFTEQQRRFLENPDDNLPERRLMVEIWQQVTQPILEQANLEPFDDLHLRNLSDNLGNNED